MNKIILSLAILASSAFSFSAYADNAAGAPEKAKQECNAKAKCEKGRKDRKSPFDGLNLSADQQSKIKELRQQCKTRKTEVRQMKAQARKEYQTQLQQILTPEQYAQYEQNMKAARHDKKYGDRRGHGKKMKGGPKGRRDSLGAAKCHGVAPAPCTCNKTDIK